MRVHHIMLSSVFYMAVPYFSTSTYKWRYFRKKDIENEMCVLLSLQHLSKTFLILRRIERNIAINVQRSSCQVLLILSYFNESLIFLTYFRKNIQI